MKDDNYEEGEVGFSLLSLNNAQGYRFKGDVQSHLLISFSLLKLSIAFTIV